MNDPRTQIDQHLIAAAGELEHVAELLRHEPEALEMRYGEREVAKTYLSQALIALLNLQTWVRRDSHATLR